MRAETDPWRRYHRRTNRLILIVALLGLLLCFLAALPSARGQTPPQPVLEHAALTQIRAQLAAWPRTQAGYRRALAPLTLAPEPFQLPADPLDSDEEHGFFALQSGLDASSTYNLSLAGCTSAVTLCGTGLQPVLDLSGANFASVRDLTLRAGNGLALLLDRRPDGASSGFHRLDNLRCEGPSAIRGSECNTLTGCHWTATDARPALTIENGAPKPLGYTMQSLLLVGGVYTNHCGGPAVLLDNTGGVLTDITFLGGDISCGGATEAAVVIRPGPGLKQVRFIGIRAEANAARDFIKIEGTANLHGLVVRDCTVYARESVVDSPAAQLHDCIFENVETHSYSSEDWGYTVTPDKSARLVGGGTKARPCIDAAVFNSKVELRSARLGRPYLVRNGFTWSVVSPANCEVRP